MKFWDSSAIVPLVVEEPESRNCRQLLRADTTQLVWTFTRLEIVSALWRELRAGNLTPKHVQAAGIRLDRLSARWNEIEPVASVRDLAERLLRVHPLRTADSLQLAAALTAFAGGGKGRAFVTLDRDLATAAEREGFDVLGISQE